MFVQGSIMNSLKTHPSSERANVHVLNCLTFLKGKQNHCTARWAAACSWLDQVPS